MAEMLVKTARQIETLAYDLLDVSRAEAGAVSVDLKPVDVWALMEEIRRAALLRPESSGMRLEVQPSPDKLVVTADSVRLSQVLANFVSNALKYGRSGGRVLIAAQPRPDGWVRVSVRDYGPGLSAAKQSELFEPFNRLGMDRSSVEGHGIGLALAKRLVELQGGRIGVDSVEGQGATFWLDLPTA
jgi:signal transduction histidine kinase